MHIADTILKEFGDLEKIRAEDEKFATASFSIPGVKSKLSMTLKVGELSLFFDFFNRDRPINRCEINRKLENENPLVGHFKHMWLAQIPPAYRVLDKQYRETGVLLPYSVNTSSSGEYFCKPNM